MSERLQVVADGVEELELFRCRRCSLSTCFVPPIIDNASSTSSVDTGETVVAELPCAIASGGLLIALLRRRNKIGCMGIRLESQGFV